MSTLTPVMTPDALDTTDVGTGDDLEARVIVFNCECHTYQQVIGLFCKCIPGMNSSRAFELAWRIDHEGQATVYSGERKLAEEIGKKLAAGGLRGRCSDETRQRNGWSAPSISAQTHGYLARFFGAAAFTAFGLAAGATGAAGFLELPLALP